jgi:DNA mismatch repair protein MutL
MENEHRLPGSGRISILPERVAHKIAAGEVIERPASVVRELIDNSIDADSRSIDLYVLDGGVKEIRVVDDGTGMTGDDLKLCFLPHATSKIADDGDLMRISTLGFRGEALSSIAASSEVEIITCLRGGTGEAVKARVSQGKLVSFGPEKGSAGTTVIVRNLFHSIPARKQFLKKPSAEGRMCRQVFIEKSLPFPDIQFRYFTGTGKTLLLPSASLKERVVTAFGSFLSYAGTMEKRETVDETLRVTVILSYPEIYRHDRRYIHIYVNSRKIDEYGFMQAVVHGYGDFLPGGRFPYAFVFIDIDPSLADFNIHPAKKEVRFRNKAKVHHAITETVRSVLYENLSGGRAEAPGFETYPDAPTGGSSPRRSPLGGPYDAQDDGRQSPGSGSTGGVADGTFQAAAERPASGYYQPERPFRGNQKRFTGSIEELRRSFPDLPDQAAVAYKGQLFSMFLLASVGDSFFIIDQHAAHERILYNRFASAPPPSQKLLVPIYFEVDEGEHEILLQGVEQFSELGIELEEAGDFRWKISAFPFPGGKLKAGRSGINPVECIREHITHAREIEKEFFARLACKAAVKEGEILEPSDALTLIRDALSLPEPRCPHGRPLWYRLEKDELFRLVGRKV